MGRKISWSMGVNQKNQPKGTGKGEGGAWKCDRQIRRWICLVAGLGCFCALPRPTRAQGVAGGVFATDEPDVSNLGPGAWSKLTAPQGAGNIQGTVVDGTGDAVAGAHVKLSRDGSTDFKEAVSDEQGHFQFLDVLPGSFQLIVAAEGFAVTTSNGTIHDGENYVVAPMTLVLVGASTEVRVSMTRTEIAEAEIKDQEKQRVLGIVPNFYVTYDPTAVPLTSKQKFELAWKATIDPVNIGLVAATAGIQQATDSWNGYGQGAQGYGKRYGASYADLVTGTFIGGAILPSLLKQDPRYFYKGTGTKKARLRYAISMAVMCKGDNGKWQANYSAILGGLAAGGISNLYYPASDRGAELTFENTLIGIGTTAAANVLQEFVIRKLTPHTPSYAPQTPQVTP
jgi:hypothetical protein